MHPAFSVIFLTTLIGAGQGLFLALYTGQVYSVMHVLAAGVDPKGFYGLGSLLAFALLAAGLIASFFHLGHPERAWRSAAQWRTSWLSREVIVLPAFMGMVVLYGAVHFLGWDPLLFTLGQVPVHLSLLLGLLATLLAFLLFLCTGMIYACLKFLQEWHSALTVINYLLLGTASGFTLATAFSAWQAPDLMRFYGGWAVVLTLAALAGRSAALWRNSRIRHKSSLQTAIGVRHTRIEQKAQGAMGGSFNTREFFHGKSADVVEIVRWGFLILAFAVPLVLLLVGLAMARPEALAAAFMVQYLGLIMERWHFFADARHPQNLYYQAV